VERGGAKDAAADVSEKNSSATGAEMPGDEMKAGGGGTAVEGLGEVAAVGEEDLDEAEDGGEVGQDGGVERSGGVGRSGGVAPLGGIGWAGSAGRNVGCCGHGLWYSVGQFLCLRRSGREITMKLS